MEGRAQMAEEQTVALVAEILLATAGDWIAGERAAVQAELANAVGLESFDALTARARGLFELESQVERARAAYVALPGSPPESRVRTGGAIASELMELLLRRLSGQEAPNGAPEPTAQPPRPPERHRGRELRRSLADLVLGPAGPAVVKGGKPLAVQFPDGTREDVRYWNDVPVAVSSWLSRKRGIPVPFAGRNRSRLWFVNAEPTHADGSPFREDGRRQVRTERQAFWIDTCRSATDILGCVERLVSACGESPRGFQIAYRPAGATAGPQSQPAVAAPPKLSRPRLPDGPAHRADSFTEAILAVLGEEPEGLSLEDLWTLLEPHVAPWLNASDRSWMPTHGKPRWQYATQWALTRLKEQGRVDNPQRGWWVLVE